MWEGLTYRYPYGSENFSWVFDGSEDVHREAAAALGHLNPVRDTDGVTRRIPDQRNSPDPFWAEVRFQHGW